MTVAFVVLNFGPPAMALAACRSIVAAAPEAVLVLVDNFSSPDNARLAREGFEALDREPPGLSYFLGLPENRGYGPGMNAGLRFAFGEHGVDLAFAVNSDITLHRFELGNLPATGLVAATVVEHGRTRVGASRFWPWLCLRRPPGRDWPGNGGRVYVEGCFAGISREAFQTVGGFSEDYFLYFEELDFIYRYRRVHGFFPRVVHEPGIVVMHGHGGATGMGPGCARSVLAEYWSARSRIFFARNWLGPFLMSAVVYNALLAVRDLAYRRLDLARAVWAGTRDAWRTGRDVPPRDGRWS